MAVVSVRLNEQEEKILDCLVEELHEEKSTLFKKALIEMYEDHQDIKFIDNYIQKSRKKKPTFISADELLKRIGD